jgi:hypothetical protein
MIVFLSWSLGFWPSIALAEYLWRQSTLSDNGLILAIIWAVGMISAFRVYRRSQGIVYDDDEDCEALLIVEASSNEDAREYAASLECERSFKKIPPKGERLTLNPDDDDDPRIFGIVDEVTDASSKKPTVWITLEKVEEYRALSSSFDWSTSARSSARTQRAA